jgi:hypothetical protein
MAMHICVNCKRECIKHAKEMCVTCYKKVHWKPKPIECKRCKRMLPNHAKGYCGGCYNLLFHLDKVKAYNVKNWHNINMELYKKVTKECIICGFNKVVDLHHLDKDKKNNSENNLIGLCPNHHKMVHTTKYRKEVIEELNKVFKEKGLPEFKPKSELFHTNNPRV